MLINLLILWTESQQNDWTCELTGLHKIQYFINSATDNLKLFQKCILRSRVYNAGKQTNKQNPWSMWLSLSLLKKDLKYLFQFRQSVNPKEVNKIVHIKNWKMRTRSPSLSQNYKQCICWLHSNHYFSMYCLKIHHACFLMLEKMYHKSSGSQTNLYSWGSCRFNR